MWKCARDILTIHMFSLGITGQSLVSKLCVMKKLTNICYSVISAHSSNIPLAQFIHNAYPADNSTPDTMAVLLSYYAVGYLWYHFIFYLWIFSTCHFTVSLSFSMLNHLFILFVVCLFINLFIYLYIHSFICLPQTLTFYRFLLNWYSVLFCSVLLYCYLLYPLIRKRHNVFNIIMIRPIIFFLSKVPIWWK